MLSLPLMAQSVIFAIAVGFGVVIAFIVVGFGRWLSAPTAEEVATSPEGVLRSDRTALISTAGVVATVVVITGVALGGSSVESLATTGRWAIRAAAIVLFCSCTAWMSYTVARLWLALRGQLPWRLMRFLRKAHASDVLRQVGSAYQFRHKVLRDYLVQGNPSIRGRGRVGQSATDTQRRQSFLKRPTWLGRIIIVGVTLIALPVTALGIVPRPLRSTIVDSNGIVYDLAFSQDGALASAGYDAVRLWDPDTGELRRVIPTNPGLLHQLHRLTATDSALDLSFSPDKATIAIDDYGKLQLWDLTTGQLRYTLARAGQIDSQPTLAFDPNGTNLATITNVGNIGFVQLWDPATGAPRRTFFNYPHFGRIEAVTFSPNGSTLATAAPDGRISLWDPAAGAQRLTWSTDSGLLPVLAFDSSGTILITIHEHGLVQLWNPATGARRHIFKIDHGLAGKLVFSPDGSTLAVADGDHVHLYDTTTGQHNNSFRTYLFSRNEKSFGSISAMAFNADSSTLATATVDGYVRLWNVAMLMHGQR